MKKFARIFRYLADYKGKVALYFLFSLLGVLFSIVSFTMIAPVLQVLFKAPGSGQVMEAGKGALGGITNYLNALMLREHPLKVLVYICVALVVLTALKNLFVYLSAYILYPIRNAVMRRLRDDMFSKTLSLPIGFFTEERKGDLISRMTNDVNEVELSIMATLESFIREPMTIIFTLTYMLLISVKLTMFLILILPVGGLIIGRIGRSLRKSSTIVQELMGAMLGTIDETIAGMRIVKAFNAETHQRLRFTAINNDDFRARNKIASRRELASPLSETMGVLVVSVILWYGGSLIFAHDKAALEPGQFLVYIALFTQVINPFKSLSNAFLNIQKGSAAVERIEQLLHAENAIKEAPDARPIKAFSESIELLNVSFAYGEKQILSGINLVIPKGKTIALVGASGAGKSTLVDLIPRFHDVSGGALLVDGVNIKDYKLDDLRRLIGVVSQEAMLFNDTLYNNITLGSGGATKERVEEAAQIAHAHSFITAKPDGYNTVAGDRGSRLSGGERQRVTIARAVLKNPPILILDEATSALDTESERAVQDAITRLMENRTCIVIAHRLSTVQNADEIIVLDAGRIAERGTHYELLQSGGMYKRLVDMQQVK